MFKKMILAQRYITYVTPAKLIIKTWKYCTTWFSCVLCRPVFHWVEEVLSECIFISSWIKCLYNFLYYFNLWHFQIHLRIPIVSGFSSVRCVTNYFCASKMPLWLFIGSIMKNCFKNCRSYRLDEVWGSRYSADLKVCGGNLKISVRMCP